MNTERSYKGSCFCGAVELTVSGEPVGMGHVVQAARIECAKLGQPMPSLPGGSRGRA